MNHVVCLRSVLVAVPAMLAFSVVGGCEPNISPPVAHDRVEVSEPHLPVAAGSDLKTRV